MFLGCTLWSSTARAEIPEFLRPYAQSYEKGVEELKRMRAAMLTGPLVMTPIPEVSGATIVDYSHLEPNVEDVSTLPITGHLRGTQGIPLPTREQLRALRKKSTPADPQIAKRHTKFVMDSMQKFMNQYKDPSPLGRCSRDRTTAKLLNPRIEKSDRNLLVDLLFIQHELLPLDPQDVYGKTVTVRAIKDPARDSNARSARGLGATCLPFRVRITKGYSMVDEGLNALMNYDKDGPFQPGELSPAVRHP